MPTNQPQTESILLEKNNGVWTLTINRPQSLNALNSLVLSELEKIINYVAESSLADCRCLVITGAGEKAFVAGADIKELNVLDEAGGKSFAIKGQSIFRKLETLKVPVIAAVNGFALGGGLELALSCDFIIASENAKLGLPEVTLGLIPGFGGTVRLSRIVGLAKAKEMIFTAEVLNAAEALSFGLVNKVVPLLELKAVVTKISETISSRGPVAVKHAKASVMKSFDQDIDSGMMTEASEFSGLFRTSDFKEGTSAFVEKRKAQFQGQ